MWGLLVAVAIGADGWGAGVGATAASGNASMVTASAFVDGRATLGPHGIGVNAVGQFGAAVADDNNTGTVADDFAGLKENQRNVGVGFDYAMSLGGRQGSDPSAPPKRPPPAVFLLANVEHRPTSGMALRPSTAVGLRVPASANPDVRSFFEVGMVVANEQYTQAAADQVGTKSNAVLGGFVGHQAVWPIGRAAWNQRIALVQNVLDTEDLRLDVGGALDVPITQTVSVRLNSEVRYDSKPVSSRFRPFDLTSGVQFVLRAM